MTLQNAVNQEQITLFAQCLSREMGITFKVKPRAEGHWGYSIVNDDCLGEEPKKEISFFVSESDYTTKKRIFIKFISPYGYSEFILSEVGCSPETLCQYRTIGRISKEVAPLLLKLKYYHDGDVAHYKKIAKLSNELLEDVKQLKLGGAESIQVKKRFSDDEKIDFDMLFQEFLKNGSVTISFTSTKMAGKFEIICGINIEGKRTLTATDMHIDDILAML